MAGCKVDGCARPHRARGLCVNHYYQAQRAERRPALTSEQRFWAKVDKANSPTGCWLWTAYVGRNGYGYFNKALAHRVAYEMVVGPIPDGRQLDHLCRVRRCCNPTHLEPVTQRENILRGTSQQAVNAAKTACDHGHPFDDANTYRRRNGHRDCRPCKARRERERQQRVREQRAA